MRYLVGKCEVEVGDRWVRTFFPDGTSLYAEPQYDEEQACTARSLGYGDDVDRMAREHDLIHSLVAEARGWPMSETLHGVATGHPADTRLATDEECIVMLVQRLLNVGLDGVLADKR